MTLSDLNEKIWALFTRGRVTGADGGRPQRVLQVELLAGDVRDDVEHMEPYGLTSEPLPDSEAIAASLAGDRNHTIVIMVADRRYRMTGLKPGEVALYDDKGRTVYLGRDGIRIDGVSDPITVTTTGDVKTQGQNVTVEAAGNLTLKGSQIILKGNALGIDAPSSTASGSFATTGDVTAGGVSLIHHTHKGDSGGSTSAPV